MYFGLVPNNNGSRYRQCRNVITMVLIKYTIDPIINIRKERNLGTTHSHQGDQVRNEEVHDLPSK